MPEHVEFPWPAFGKAEDAGGYQATASDAGGALLAPMYYTTDQLEKRPEALQVAELDPPEIQHIPVAGKLILKLWIDTQGVVVNVDVEESELSDAVTQTAVSAFAKFRFSPGERDGQAVGSVMRIEVSYGGGFNNRR